MNDRLKQVGFSQRLRVEWLEQTANLVLINSDKETVYGALQNLLRDELSVGGNAQRGNREKAITILMKIWFNVPKGLESFKDEGLELFRTLPKNDHKALHWGMAMAVYPFFGAVGETVGRLLKLQDSLTASQVQRRLRERFGERETVARAARRILRSFVDWEVLLDTTKKGVYRGAPAIAVEHTSVTTWLVEAVLRASGATANAFKAVLDSPALFPFKLCSLHPSELRDNRRLELFRQSLDEDMLTLRDNRLSNS